jgi:hypothetical protein
VDDEGIARGTGPQALVARRKRVGDGDEGERIAFRRPLVLLVLARVAADLGEALVLEEPAAARVRMDTVEHAPTLGVLVPALVDILADHAAAEGGAGAVDLLDVAGPGTVEAASASGFGVPAPSCVAWRSMERRSRTTSQVARSFDCTPHVKRSGSRSGIAPADPRHRSRPAGRCAALVTSGRDLELVMGRAVCDWIGGKR